VAGNKPTTRVATFQQRGACW